MGFVQGKNALAVVPQMKGHIEAGQRQALDHLLQVVEFGFLGLEELATSRGIEKQVAHFHRRTDRVGRRLNPGFHLTPFGFHLPGLIGVAGSRGQGQAGHGADGCQGLTAKAQAHHLLKVFQIANLAGGMARQGQRQLFGGDATAIVAHPQQLDPGLLDIHIDTPGAGVEAVFQQLLSHSTRSLLGRQFSAWNGQGLTHLEFIAAQTVDAA